MSTDKRTWFRLDVIQDDIDGASCRIPEKCVLALAANRVLSSGDMRAATSIYHCGSLIRFPDDKFCASLQFHDIEAFRRYIDIFDKTGRAEPAAFVAVAFDLNERVVDILRAKNLLLDGEPATT